MVGFGEELRERQAELSEIETVALDTTSTPPQPLNWMLAQWLLAKKDTMADAALYEAKNAGRNCVRLARGESK